MPVIDFKLVVARYCNPGILNPGHFRQLQILRLVAYQFRDSGITKIG